MENLTAIIEQSEEGGYFSYCHEVSGANGQGETIDECFEDLQLAIQFIFEELRELAIAKASPRVIYKEIAFL
jgi:predicted RNase H-like HicB family nuclease